MGIPRQRRKRKEPKRASVTIQFEVPMSYDDDVDWSDPQKVFLEQFDCVGIHDFLGQNIHEGTLICCEWED